MGALLSIPLLAVPSIGTLTTFAASCCGAATCSAVCSMCGKCQGSTATRIAYALILLINSILSWIMFTPWAMNKLQHLTLDYMKITCDGKECHGFVAVHRINFALGLFHAVLAVILLGVRTSKDGRAAIQNGFWGPKIIAWLGLIVLTFLIPEGFFITWGNYFALVGAILFVLLGLILLVDLAHTWAEYCLEKIETNEDSRVWRVVLLGSTLSMYLAAVALTIVMYIFFARGGCSMNQAAITVNLLLLLAISLVSVHPVVQEYNPQAGLGQSAMVAFYCTYLTMSAVSMEPDDKHCNPLIRARGTRTASVVIGAIVTMLTIAYTTTRAATQGVAMGSKKQAAYVQLGSEEVEHGLVTQQPSTRREMRADALRAAVASGSLPASALDDSDDDSDDEGAPKDDERGSTQYNYSLFHIIFLLATTWVATLLTMNVELDKTRDFVPVGRTYWASWVKIVHQIQSGQVIVDLCSVAKELVENSLDAGATSIDVRFKNNGLDFIEVQDNGQGISSENYETIALKHYTSKLSSYAQLESLQTFGFRGEALSSLCALSDMYIVTARADEAPKGKKLEFDRSGRLKGTQVTATPKGTTVVVENLFHTLPVRRKELEKNIKREYVKVLSVLQAYACISTGVKFTVGNHASKGKRAVVFATKANATTRDNIANVFGSKTLSTLMPLDLESELQPTTRLRRDTNNDKVTQQVRVLGHISRPSFGEARQAPDRQMFFVNGRPCGLPQVAKAFNEIYKSYSVAQSPFIMADLRMDTSSYDVNVSPDKRTIFLHDQSALLEALKTSVTKLLEAQDLSLPPNQLGGQQLPGYKQLSLRRQSTNASIATAPDTPFDSGSGDDAEANNDTQPQSLDATLDTNEPTAPVNHVSSNSRRPEVAEIERSKLGNATEQPQRTLPPVQRLLRTSTSQDDESRNIHSSISEDTSADIASSVPGRQSYANKNWERNPSPILGDEQPNRQPQMTDPIPAISLTQFRRDSGTLQDRFDRVRPRRRALETATITIGSKTVTAQLHPLPKEPKVEPSRAKDNLGQSQRHLADRLRAFSASGTQQESNESLDAEDQPSPTASASDHESTVADDQAVPSSPTARVIKPAVNDNEFKTASTDGSDQHHDSATGSDEEYVDEAEKKIIEETKVSELIHQAEEQARHPHEHATNRSKVLGAATARSGSTFQLVQNLNISIEKIENLVATLRSQFQQQPQSQPPVTSIIDHNDEPDQAVKQASTVEERLSLTVSKDDFRRMKIVGQFNLGFILATRPSTSCTPSHPPSTTHEPLSGPKTRTTTKSELFIIDQHASDEIYNFERLQSTTIVQNQPLVTPRVLDLTAIEEETVISNRSVLEKNGFIIEVDDTGSLPIGRRCKLVSLPMSREVVFDMRDLEELLALLVDAPPQPTPASISLSPADRKVGGEDAPAASTSRGTGLGTAATIRPSKVRRMFAMRACRSSIMIGRTLTLRQMEKVVRHMAEIERPWNCPHGRPTMRHVLSLDEWEGEWAEPGMDMEAWKEFITK